MHPLLKKLQYKEEGPMLIVGSPQQFAGTMKELAPYEIHTEPKEDHYNFILIFVKSQHEVEQYAGMAVERLHSDGVLWFAYPKKTSKKYEADIHRDRGWDALNCLNYTGVRQIAIDEDWSALRFRHKDLIKSK
ncbi:DUF3052 domain-containing protein [Marinicrinis lubricantis]|uniref:DUF3052 domain-containing protein n=1 Tax=Marinicrinis lubricantis TaxID=2086470 RepID=A0ABW1ILW8_9BACL